MYYKEKRQRWEDAVRKFWENVEVRGEDECWEWIGGKDIGTGYGMCYNGKVTIPAHRMSWMISYGTIPKLIMRGNYYRKAVIRHLCGNRKCVNPNHLELGTYSDNTNDRYRLELARTERSRVKLSEIDVREARIMRNAGKTYVEIGRHFNVYPGTARRAILGMGIYGEVIDEKMTEKIIKLFN